MKVSFLPGLLAKAAPLIMALLAAGPAAGQGGCLPWVWITPQSLPSGVAGAAYLQALNASGGTAPYTFSVTSGSLPGGLTLSSGGLISGTPDKVGSFSFAVGVLDSSNTICGYAGGITFSLIVGPWITTSSPLPPATVGVTYLQTLTVLGGNAPYTWSIASGALPPGLTLSAAGVISGTPTLYGTSAFTVSVRESSSATSSQAFALTVNPAPLAITTPYLESGVAGTPYSRTLTATGGVPPYTWVLASGSLPPLLTLSTGGVISGTPTTPGSSAFSVSVTDSASHTTSQTFTLIINTGPLTISSPATLPSAVAGVAYSQTLTATGGVPPYTWQVVSGSWPAGLSMSTAGAITGTPAAAGSYAFTTKVTDSASTAATQAFALTVAAAGTLARVGVMSQIAAGGGWDTTIWLVNRSSASVQASVVFRGDDGSALTLPLTVTQPGFSQQVTASTVQETIAPNTMLVVATGTVSSSSAVQGWADVLASGALSGFAVHRYSGASEVTFPLQSQFGSSFSMPFDQTGGYVTGVALVNLAGWQANVTASVCNQYGNQIVSQQPITFAKTDFSGYGHDAFMLADRLPATAGIRGIVQFQSNGLTPMGPVGQLAGLDLRASPGGSFTSLPTTTP